MPSVRQSAVERRALGGLAVALAVWTREGGRFVDAWDAARPGGDVAARPRLDRRDLLVRGLGVAAATIVPPPLAALADSPAPQPTSVALDLAIGSGQAGTVETLDIELFPEAAPASVAAFVAFARGDLEAGCQESDDDLAPARVKTSRLAFERACLDTLGEGVSMLGSTLWRIVPDYRIDLGRVAAAYALRAPPAFAAETNSLRHDVKGAVSVRRGGGAFEFTVAPAPNVALDKEDLVVIGRVTDASLPTLDRLNAIPSKRSPFDFAVPPLGGSFARACEYSSPDPTCAQFKPLKKIVVSRVRVTGGGDPVER
mmetsp:Transcript_22393/g.88905  ORF Transcript_22393/g.88905 Transcript_22393/m.88905 type:complete len:313 (-) Transcript_22393:146-1084(-)